MKVRATILALGMASLLSDVQVKELSDQPCAQIDKDNQVAVANYKVQSLRHQRRQRLGDGAVSAFTAA